jgi:hypothetical protein
LVENRPEGERLRHAMTPNEPRPLRLDPYRLPLWLLGASVGLVIAHVVAKAWLPLYFHGQGGTVRLIRFLDLDQEGNLPSWYSAMLWTLAALLAFCASAQRQKTARARNRWTALGALYLFLSMDELSAFHEMLGIALRRVQAFVSWFHYAWLAYGLAFTAVVAAYFAPFVLRLPRYVLGCILTAAAIYLFGAVFLEWYAGMVRDGVLRYPLGLSEFHEIIGEEFLEMVGVIVLIHGLLMYLRGNDPSRAFTIAVGGPTCR